MSGWRRRGRAEDHHPGHPRPSRDLRDQLRTACIALLPLPGLNLPPLLRQSLEVQLRQLIRPPLPTTSPALRNEIPLTGKFDRSIYTTSLNKFGHTFVSIRGRFLITFLFGIRYSSLPKKTLTYKGLGWQNQTPYSSHSLDHRPSHHRRDHRAGGTEHEVLRRTEERRSTASPAHYKSELRAKTSGDSESSSDRVDRRTEKEQRRYRTEIEMKPPPPKFKEMNFKVGRMTD